MTQTQTEPISSIGHKTAQFAQLTLLGKSLLRNYSEGCVSRCLLYQDPELQELRWELVLSNASGPLREPAEHHDSLSKLSTLTHFTFAATIQKLMSGVARDGSPLAVSRYGPAGFGLDLGIDGLSLSISYEPARSGPPAVSFFALTMDSTGYQKPFEVIMAPVTAEAIQDAVERTLVELRSYMTTKRIRGLSANKRHA